MSDYLKKLREKNTAKDSGKEKAVSDSTEEKEQQTREPSTYLEKLRAKNTVANNAAVDSDFIDSFLSDARKYSMEGNTLNARLKYGTSASIYESRKKTADDLRSRASAISQHIEKNRGSIPEEYYKSMKEYLENFVQYTTSSLYSLYHADKYYSQFETEDEYNARTMTSEDLKAKIDSISSAKDDVGIIQGLLISNMPYNREYAEQDGRDMSVYDTVEQNREYISKKYGITFTEDYYANDEKLTSLMKKLDDGDSGNSAIAYTTKEGQNITWKMLYDNRYAEEDLTAKLGEYSQKADWDKLSQGISGIEDTRSDYDILLDLRTSTVPYDRETAKAYGIDMDTYDDIEKKREYISNKYGVDLNDDIYNNVNIFNDLMAKLEDKAGEKGNFEYMSYLTDEEKQVLNYIYHTQGRAAALEWHNSRKNLYEDRFNGIMVDQLSDFGAENKFWGSVGSVALSLASGVEALCNIAEYYATGELNQSTMARASTALRSGVMQEIDWEINNWDAFDFLYGTAMSAIDSRLSMGLFGIAGGTMLGLSAAAQATNDAIDRGMDKKSAFRTGFLAGVFECLFETWSISKFKSLKEVASANGRDIALNIGKSMLTNASEETLTEIANIGYDIIMNGDFSQYETLVRQYELGNMSEESARRKASRDLALQIVESGASGALMGLGFGVTGSSGPIIYNTLSAIQSDINANAVAKGIVRANGGADALRDLANEVAAVSSDRMKSRIIKQAENVADKATKRNVKNLYKSVTSANYAQDKSDIAKSLVNNGISEKTANAIADALVESQRGKIITVKQQELLEAYAEDGRVSTALREVYDRQNSGINQRAVQMNKFKAGIILGNMGRTVNDSGAKQTAPGQENAPATDMVDGENKTASEGRYEASADGRTIIKATGEDVAIKGIESIKDGKMTLRTEDGRTMDAADVSFGTAEEALVYETVAKMGVSVDTANVLVNAFDPGKGISGQMYGLDIQEAYNFGALNYEVEYAKDDPYAIVKKMAWNDGRATALKASAKAQSDVDATFQKAEETLKQTSRKVSGEYHATLEDDITVLSLSESEKASYHLEDQIAQAAKVNIRVYHGVDGEMGYYNPKTDEIYLNLNAKNKSRESKMAFVLAHELVHRAKNGSPAKYQKFADFLIAEYGRQGSDVEAMIAEQLAAAKEHDLEMTREKALEEVVADACQRMLLDTDAGKKLAAFGAESKQNKSFLEDVKRWISEFMDKLRELFRDVDTDSLAAKEFAKFDENVKQILADMYVDMTIDAGEHLSTIKAAFGEGTIVETNENGEFTMAQSADGSEKVFNLVTWENGGRETLEAALLREGYSEEEVKAALTIMDGKHELVKRIANEVTEGGAMAFPEQGRINEVTLTTDLKDGHSVLSALVSNGDYPVNIDLLMICKKRKAYQRVINRLCETGMIKEATVDALAIAEINKILGKYGFETACLGCFVESRRLRIQEWAQTIVKEWNSEVKKRNPQAKAFGFGKGEAKLTQDEVMQLIGELESGGEKNDKGNLNLGQGSAVKRMGVLLDKVPSLRKTLTVEDLITPDGLAALRRFDSNLFSMVKSRYGSNSPKFVQEFNPYNHELAVYGKVPQQYKSLREYLYAIGGARMQSFSDFIVENWFDYCQIVADLAARKLPMHTYTKEIALAKLFGMTGIKINMSLIPDVDRSLGKEYAGLTRNAKGELELIWADKDRFKATGGKSYMQSINFADAIALQNDPRYSGNVGTIAVGISDMHIRMMLNDSRIRMVIPYHSSGMNPIFADMMGTSYYKDYTNFQNTTVKQIYNSKGEPVTLKLTKPQTSQLTGGFQFNEALQDLGDARAAAEAYKEWCADASKHTITIKGETYTAELAPKFNDFADEKNYYKLLEDFNPYDCITEEAAPQGDVQQIYPDGFEDILRAELSGQEKHRQKQEKNQAFDKAMGEIESYLKNHTKADTVHYANQHGIKLGAKDKKLDAAGKERLKQLQQEGASFMLPKSDDSFYQEPAYQEWDVQAALYDALYHADKGYENMIRVGEMPRYITAKIGIEGDFYIYRNHAYDNMVSREQAIKDGRPVVRKGEKVHFHDLGVDTMTEAIMSLENPIMTIATKTKDGNPAVIMLLPVEGKNKAPLYAVLSFYSNRHINGDRSKRPHVVLTIAEREFFGSKGRSGYAEIVGNAVKDGRVIDFNKKMRDDLSVIANPAGVGNITDSSLSDNLARFRKEIKSFREKNHIDYKLPVGEDTSPRALLANAFEGVVKDSEKQKLQEYRDMISVIEAEEQKLRELRGKIKELSFAKGPKDTKAIRSLQFEANQTANRISTYDKQLLRLEAAKPLQDVLAREKELVRKREQKRTKEAVEAYREKATKTQRELMDRWEQSRKKAVEGREKTAMRHKIQNVVGELNSLLLSNDKKRHVPDSLKKAVADALDLVNMDTVGAEERAAKYAALIAKETDPDKIDAYTMTMENILRQGEKMGQRLKELHDAYEEIQQSDDPDIANAYDPVIAGCLRELSQSIGNTSLRNMSIEQLSDVYDMYRMVLTRVRDANKAMQDNIKENISNLASRTIGEVRMTGGDHKYRAAILDPVMKFLWNNTKPVYAMEWIGSKTLTKVFGNVRAGEDVWAKDIIEAREFYLDKAQKYGYDSWDFKKKYTFESVSGEAFELTLEQILSLYAYSKRNQAHDHLRLGGFVFDSNIETYKEKDGKSGKSLIKYKVNSADAHQITPEILADITGKLTAEQTGFVDEMQGYLSTVMGAKGNEVTMKMYGVKLFKEKFYFPLKSAKQFMFEQNEVSGEVRIKNSGFTNKVVAKANNPVILSNFMDVWAGHVNDMSMYHAFALPLEDFNRVFNYNSPKKEGQPPVSVKGTIQNAYGPSSVGYVKQLITDLNGGARSDSTTDPINKLIGMFKKGAVLASLSVVVQQPSAIARAAALVDMKYFIGPKLDYKRHSALWEEVKQYAPVAIIKEMGYFDTNMGKSTQDFILGREYSGVKDKMKALVTDGGYRDEVLSKAPALADEIAWCCLWEAVKRETKAKHPDMDVKSEAFLKLAGERFTEVITKTQVYDSVLARSANMRSKDTGMKMATAFMAEPTTSINMIADALMQGKRGNRKYCRSAIGAVIASQILNSILVSFVYAGRDDDEEKTYWEKYASNLVGNTIESINPLGYIPFIKDIISIVKGYDVERSDMSVISDLWKAYESLGKDNVSAYRKVEGFAGSIAQIFGLPVKNIMRDVRGIYQTVSSFIDGESGTKTGMVYAITEGITGTGFSNGEQLLRAHISGDTDHLKRVMGRYESEEKAESALKQAIKKRYESGMIDAKTARDYLSKYAGEDIHEAHWTVDKWNHAIENGTSEDYEKYGQFYDAVRTGKDLKNTIKEYTDNGVKQDTLRGQITEHFKPEYLKMSASERAGIKGYLVNGYVLTGLSREKAMERIGEWDFEAKYGFAYEDRKQAYIDGKISASELKKAVMTTGGKTEAEANKYIADLEFEKANGYDWSDRASAYKSGEISAEELRQDLIEFGGYDADDADAQIEAYDWQADGYEDVTAAAVQQYNAHCADSKVPKDIYLHIRKFSNNTENDVDPATGKTVYYSAMKKVIAEIDAQNLSAAQKTAIARSLGWADKNIQKYKTW